MRHRSLFSGIGGFDLAAEWMGWENVFHCEINPFGRKILKYYWPSAISYEDATKTDWSIYRGRIDVLSGGDPCQGNSVIGKMQGENYEGFLWPEMFRAAEQILPGWIINENVAGSISNGIVDRKIKDLQDIGYTCWPPIMEIDMQEVQKSFDRTDKLNAFKKELTRLINYHSIDSLLDLPDSVLASVAIGQMQIVSSIASGLQEGKYPAILIC